MERRRRERMGGKEERVSRVGRARAAGRPEPSTDELLGGNKGSRGDAKRSAGSRRARGGTTGLEPEVRG